MTAICKIISLKINLNLKNLLLYNREFNIDLSEVRGNPNEIISGTGILSD